MILICIVTFHSNVQNLKRDLGPWGPFLAPHGAIQRPACVTHAAWIGCISVTRFTKRPPNIQFDYYYLLFFTVFTLGVVWVLSAVTIPWGDRRSTHATLINWSWSSGQGWLLGHKGDCGLEIPKIDNPPLPPEYQASAVENPVLAEAGWRKLEDSGATSTRPRGLLNLGNTCSYPQDSSIYVYIYIYIYIWVCVISSVVSWPDYGPAAGRRGNKRVCRFWETGTSCSQPNSGRSFENGSSEWPPMMQSRYPGSTNCMYGERGSSTFVPCPGFVCPRIEKWIISYNLL